MCGLGRAPGGFLFPQPTAGPGSRLTSAPQALICRHVLPPGCSLLRCGPVVDRATRAEFNGKASARLQRQFQPRAPAGHLPAQGRHLEAGQQPERRQLPASAAGVPDPARHYWHAQRQWSDSYLAGSVAGTPPPIVQHYIEQRNHPVQSTARPLGGPSRAGLHHRRERRRTGPHPGSRGSGDSAGRHARSRGDRSGGFVEVSACTAPLRLGPIHIHLTDPRFQLLGTPARPTGRGTPAPGATPSTPPAGATSRPADAADSPTRRTSPSRGAGTDALRPARPRLDVVGVARVDQLAAARTARSAVRMSACTARNGPAAAVASGATSRTAPRPARRRAPRHPRGPRRRVAGCRPATAPRRRSRHVASRPGVPAPRRGRGALRRPTATTTGTSLGQPRR